MNILISLIYGVIQGLSEFLPVSSSGHLALMPYVMKFEDPGVLFDLMMHVGTAFAVMVYFRRDLIRLIKGSLFLITNPKKLKQADPFVLNFIFATIVSVIFILLIKDFAESYGRSSKLIAINLIVFGIILFISDIKKEQSDRISPMESQNKWMYSFLIGMSQSFAIFPGVSRSGITITAGRFLGLNRREASSFSFLLSLPIIVAGAAKKLIDVKFQLDSSIGITNLSVGLVVSFIVGILTIHFFLKFISKTPMLVFTIYRIILGILILSL